MTENLSLDGKNDLMQMERMGHQAIYLRRTAVAVNLPPKYSHEGKSTEAIIKDTCVLLSRTQSEPIKGNLIDKLH